jgi:hypothetical protein
MTNRDAIRRHLSIIENKLQTLDNLCETELVGDDARHLFSDIQGARREFIRTDADSIQESYDIKPLYDRLKVIQTSLRVLRNTLDQCDDAITAAMQSCGSISAEVEEVEDDEL